MTAEGLKAFAAQVRAECDEALPRLAAVDPTAPPPDLRKEYEQQREGWERLRALTEDEALSLHELACLYAGRELTQEEAGALLTKH